MELLEESSPSKFVESVNKGVQERSQKGVLAGYPVVDVKVTCYDGMTHAVDSSDMAFKIAGAMCFRDVVLQCKPILLEPIMKVEVSVPDEYMGGVIGDLNTKRGKILGMNPNGNRQLIQAEVPLGEMFQYSIDLRSVSQARGSFVMEYSHYETVPGELSKKIIAAYKHEDD